MGNFETGCEKQTEIKLRKIGQLLIRLFIILTLLSIYSTLLVLKRLLSTLWIHCEYISWDQNQELVNDKSEGELGSFNFQVNNKTPTKVAYFNGIVDELYEKANED